MVKIAIVGSNGKMGKLLVSKLKNNYTLIEIDKNDSIEKAIDAEMVIDFSTARNSVKTAKWCADNYKKLIIGATGQSVYEINKIINASKKTPIMIAGNFSVGIAKLKIMLNEAVCKDLLSIVILEKHHHAKIDKPSGTALELEKELKNLTACPIEILSIRGGKEIGIHEISFYFENEVIRLSHQAFSRDAFANGVIKAVDFMKNQSVAQLYDVKNI